MVTEAFVSDKMCGVLKPDLLNPDWVRTVRKDGSILYTIENGAMAGTTAIYCLSTSLVYIERDMTFSRDCMLPKLKLDDQLSISHEMAGEAWIFCGDRKEPVPEGSVIFSGASLGTWPESTSVLCRKGVHYIQQEFCTNLKVSQDSFLDQQGLQALKNTLARSRATEINIPYVAHDLRFSQMFRLCRKEQIERPEARRLFYQGITLGLCSLLTEKGVAGLGVWHTQIDQEECALLKRARDMVTEDLIHPKTLKQIAHEIGMN
jgi:hypothetical protein